MVQTHLLPPLHLQSIVWMFPHVDSRLVRGGTSIWSSIWHKCKSYKYWCGNWGAARSQSESDILRLLTGQTKFPGHFYICESNAVELPWVPLSMERGSFDRIFKGSECRKPQQCQVYAPLSPACSMNLLFLLNCKDHRLWARDWSSQLCYLQES